jgi:hypothetical protein
VMTITYIVLINIAVLDVTYVWSVCCMRVRPNQKNGESR